MKEYSTKNSKAGKQMRTDASENRLTIINTARALFVERGPELSMSEIAKVANVSRATLYRNFEDKSDLVLSLMVYNLEQLEIFAQKLERDENEFFVLIKKTAELQFLYQGLIPFLPESVDAINNRIVSLMEGPVNRAKSRGILVEDFDVLKDTSLIVTMLGSATLRALDMNLKGSMDRAIKIVFKGISPEK